MATKQWTKPPAMAIDPTKRYTATMTTSRGAITIALEAAAAPITVNNFVFLARQGFYDGVKFHRVIAGFVIQGGDPTGTGRGGPGYTFGDEVDPKTNPNTHTAFALSMANAGPGTNGSQFFITHAPQPHLNGRHTVFCHVLEGKDVVLAVRAGDEILTLTIDEQ